MRTRRFSAEASLYISSGHYRTGEHALSLFRETNRLRLARDESEAPPIVVGDETIVIFECPPGWSRGEDGQCRPLTEPLSGSGGLGGPGTPGGSLGGGGGVPVAGRVASPSRMRSRRRPKNTTPV
jgi:hypothetical protein